MLKISSSNRSISSRARLLLSRILRYNVVLANGVRETHARGNLETWVPCFQHYWLVLKSCAQTTLDLGTIFAISNLLVALPFVYFDYLYYLPLTKTKKQIASG